MNAIFLESASQIVYDTSETGNQSQCLMAQQLSEPFSYTVQQYSAWLTLMVQAPCVHCMPHLGAICAQMKHRTALNLLPKEWSKAQ